MTVRHPRHGGIGTGMLCVEMPSIITNLPCSEAAPGPEESG